MKSTFSYDPRGDSIIIYNRSQNEKTKKNFMFGNFVISLSNSGKITGLEINEFTAFLKDYDLNSSIISKIKNIELDISVQRDLLTLKLKLESNKLQKSLPVTRLPLQTISF
jgi:uncharacterized protein YuzE